MCLDKLVARYSVSLCHYHVFFDYSARDSGYVMYSQSCRYAVGKYDVKNNTSTFIVRFEYLHLAVSSKKRWLHISRKS